VTPLNVLIGGQASPTDSAPPKAPVFDQAKDSRATGIAAGLSVFLAGFATHEAGKQIQRREGVDVTKTWVTGSNPRAEHAAINGETVDIDATFSNGMDWPGDGGPDDAGCNCSVEINVPRRARMLTKSVPVTHVKAGEATGWPRGSSRRSSPSSATRTPTATSSCRARSTTARGVEGVGQPDPGDLVARLRRPDEPHRLPARRAGEDDRRQDRACGSRASSTPARTPRTPRRARRPSCCAGSGSPSSRSPTTCSTARWRSPTSSATTTSSAR
jgi:hypothetical protein